MGRFYVSFVEQAVVQQINEEHRPRLSADLPLTSAVVVPENYAVKGCVEISSECASILIGMLP
jgi:predicted 2-oxoglutarate/Fe(II)-dependent dioxygenase YbiX